MSQPFIDLSDGMVTIGGNVNIGSGGRPTQDIKFIDSDGKITVLKKGEPVSEKKGEPDLQVGR